MANYYYKKRFPDLNIFVDPISHDGGTAIGLAYLVHYQNVAKLIAEKNIVTLFQGRSEAGPRALGNRSILYDPTDPDGKDTVNKVKGREWFRPFAGSMLKEHFEEWFDVCNGL